MNAFAPGAVLGVVVSLLFEYVPGLSGWYNGLKDEYQQLFMLGVLALVVGGAFGLSCADWEYFYTCDQLGAKDAIYAFVGALVGSQGAYLISPKKS